MDQDRNHHISQRKSDALRAVDRRRILKSSVSGIAGAGAVLAFAAGGTPLLHAAQAAGSAGPAAPTTHPTLHKSIEIDGLNIFYREAGPKDAPTILLLHGFPTSSQMFRNLIPALSDRFHVVAPDYPGFGNSASPSVPLFSMSSPKLP